MKRDVRFVTAEQAVELHRDGNKRAGAAAMRVFLELNGPRIHPSPLKTAARMVELQVRSEAGESAGRLISWLSQWLREQARRPRSRRQRKRG